jgi:hypothetical protein
VLPVFTALVVRDAVIGRLRPGYRPAVDRSRCGVDTGSTPTD